MKQNTLFVLVGPTGVGKTDLSIALAKHLNCPIISADSRQLFKEMKIGTAAPTDSYLQMVQHYFVAEKSIHDSYSAGQYEVDVLNLLEKQFETNPYALMVGGSMMYIDAVCNGLDDIPAVKDEFRNEVLSFYQDNGLVALQERLLKLDPIYYNKVDLNNVQRVMHAVEVSLMLGVPYSSLLKNNLKPRAFNIVKIGIDRPREELYARINQRVDEMMQEGLLKEAESLYPYKNLNSLNTVGYKELFNYFAGVWTLDFAINMIKQDSRRYAKRQLTWFRRDESIKWFHPSQELEIFSYVDNYNQNS